MRSDVVAQRKGRFGKRAIVHALRERGIVARRCREGAVAARGSDEADAMPALWQRRFGQAPRDEREKARQVRFLQARGYSLSVALAVLRKAGVADADEAL